MSPYHSYPLGTVRLGRGVRTQVRPWDVIDALTEHATKDGLPLTERSAHRLLAMLTRAGSYVSRSNTIDGRVLVVTTTTEPPLTTVTLDTPKTSR